MNKDVKIGLAIGLLLLVALFVWFAFISGEKRPVPEKETVAPAPPPATTTTQAPPAAVEGAPPATDYFTRDNGGAAGDTGAVELGTEPVAGTPELTPEARRYLDMLKSGTTKASTESATSTTATTETAATSATTATTEGTTDLASAQTGAASSVSAEPSTWVVKQGEYLSTISQKVYGSAAQWERIARANNIDNPARLRVGMVLTIPPLPEENRASVEQPLAGTGALEPQERFHTVTEGDTLSDISKRYYGSTGHTKLILEANRLDDENLLRIGSKLRIPNLEAAPEVGNAAVVGTENAYVVREGDTLGSISQRFYQTSRHYDLIMRANNIDNARALRVGQKLVIPAKPEGGTLPADREGTEPGTGTEEKRYVVEEGDTLGDIAARELGSSRYYTELMKRNNITDAYLLRTGQVLIIPSRSSVRVLSTEVRDN